MWRPLLLVFLWPWLSLASGLASAQSFTLSLDDINGSGWAASQVRVSMQSGGGATLAAGRFTVQGREFKNVALDCTRFVFDRVQIRCEGGKLRGGGGNGGSGGVGADGANPALAGWPLELVYETQSKRLQLAVAPAPDERWVLRLAGNEVTVELERARIDRIAPFLDGEIAPNAGHISGKLRYAPARVSVDMTFSGLGFTDKAGLRAGEKLAGRLRFDTTRDGAAWNWSGALDWNEGAVFWDPVFIASGGHRVEARGTQTTTHLQVANATLDWRGLGRVTAALTWDRRANRVAQYAVSGRALALAGLREFVSQTWAEQNQLTDLRLAGTADLSFEGTAGRIRRAAITLHGVQIDAAQRALALDNLNADLRFDARLDARVDARVDANSAQGAPGTNDSSSGAPSTAGTVSAASVTHPPAASPIKLSFDALRLRGLTFGPVAASGEMHDGRLTIPNLLVPVLGGVLALAEIDITEDAIQLQGALTPIPMEKLAAAFGWHPLGGDLSFVLPKVTYAKSTLTLDGALLFKLFGGDAQVDNIRLADPFGRTPRLTADVHLKRLNLEEMTGAVKFGTITGYLDVNVDELVMENWQPQSMNAKVLTSEGSFRKRISQRAVQNISSIGGAGAGAAIQRSFLSFFETFGYDKIGISCKLRNGVCEMGGAESASGGYTLIKGGGLPSVNVVGYNRFVGWQELLDRIKAVIDGNSQIIVK